MIDQPMMHLLRKANKPVIAEALEDRVEEERLLGTGGDFLSSGSFRPIRDIRALRQAQVITRRKALDCTFPNIWVRGADCR